jgi:hypothetical protein
MKRASYIVPVVILLAVACMPVTQSSREYWAVVMCTIDNLRIALSCYHDDVGYYPPGDAERDEGNMNMVLALSDKSAEDGGKGGPFSPYYEFREYDLMPSEHRPSCKVLVDPWDAPYRYVRATDNEGNIKPEMLDKNPKTYSIWSCGRNGKDENGAGDDITSWSKVPDTYRSRPWEEAAIGTLFIILGLIAGFGLLFVRVDEGSLKTASKIAPWARLYRYKVFRYFAAAICFALAIYGLYLISG